MNEISKFAEKYQEHFDELLFDDSGNYTEFGKFLVMSFAISFGLAIVKAIRYNGEQNDT